VKTTIELPDDLFREAKATAARRGTALKQLVREALEEKLAREEAQGQPSGPRREWPVPPPNVPLEELRAIDAFIEEAFEQIEPEDLE
jgi:hypothetical protein